MDRLQIVTQERNSSISWTQMLTRAGIEQARVDLAHGRVGRGRADGVVHARA
jgi:hypothetical protein